jgi:hypothetical protein
MRSVYEKAAHKKLESEGWKVDYKIRPRICPKGYRVDYFSLFDLLAVRAGDPIRWISIKGVESSLKKHKKAIQDFFLPEGNQKELWMYRYGLKRPPIIIRF